MKYTVFFISIDLCGFIYVNFLICIPFPQPLINSHSGETGKVSSSHTRTEKAGGRG